MEGLTSPGTSTVPSCHRKSHEWDQWGLGQKGPKSIRYLLLKKLFSYGVCRNYTKRILHDQYATLKRLNLADEDNKFKTPAELYTEEEIDQATLCLKGVSNPQLWTCIIPVSSIASLIRHILFSSSGTAMPYSSRGSEEDIRPNRLATIIHDLEKKYCGRMSFLEHQTSSVSKMSDTPKPVWSSSRYFHEGWRAM